ncbi:hypothetical protein HanXRQr2_Chr09g0387811 [Helianthus annuus]|uniref:Uncharacterized protein n=1 Tax=Helianthus annuus TaxID=4232 RepID=A0A9K3I6L0_HELAN|nr:hypothetical protein HanXRQr2_Chr09g0387811 [Helianthus annuus]KAJ0893098.1 hypothetical protein HanPSC8_Chr09g0373701 [Helianthus annuus]
MLWALKSCLVKIPTTGGTWPWYFGNTSMWRSPTCLNCTNALATDMVSTTV